jgi:hypothetical protein
MKRKDLNKEIIRLTELWYKYVNLSHHKDCDCHWYINSLWSYGAKPHYEVEHNGYVFEADPVIYSTYQQAQKGLIKMLNKAFKEEKDWAKEVLKDPMGWDSEQFNQAKFLQEL